MTTIFPSRGRAIGALAAIIFIGISVRAPVTSLPAVLGEIQDAYDLSPSASGLLTSLPVLCFGIGAAVIARLARRFGTNRVLIVSLLALTLFVWIRPFTGVTVFFLATIGVGLAISAGNVLLPVVVRRDFYHRQGPVLSTATTSMSGGAALAAIGTIPLWVLFGWQWALALWGVITLIAVLTFSAFTGPEARLADVDGSTSVWKLPGAWVMAVFFGLNSGLYYASTHWLPTILPDLAGITTAQAGVAASIFQFGGLAGTLTVPLFITRVYRRQLLATAITAMFAIYTFGLLLAPQFYLVWMIPGAYAQGGVFALLVSLYVLRSPNLNMVRDVAGMTQTLGYFLSALAPVSVGALFEFTGSWTAPLTLMAIMSALLVVLTPLTASRKKLTDRGPATA